MIEKTNGRANIARVLLAATLVAGVAACERHEGPAERAGKEIDRSMDKAGDKMHDAGDKMKDAAEDAKDAAKRAAD